MTFALEWSPQARDDLARLPAPLQVRIVRKAEAARADPLRFFRRLTGARVWRLRVGEPRVLADIDLRARRIGVLHVGHWKTVYRR